MVQKLPGFILIESITAISISLIVISTLSLTVSEEYKLIQNYESRVTAHKLMLQTLRDDKFPQTVVYNGNTYQIQRSEKSVRVKASGNKTYQITW